MYARSEAPAARSLGPNLVGAKIALVAFDSEESARFGSLLGGVRCLVQYVDPQSTAVEGAAAYSALVLNLVPALSDSEWSSILKLLALNVPILAVGTCAELHRMQAIQANAAELLVRPFEDSELLLRLGRCLHRVSVPPEGNFAGVEEPDKYVLERREERKQRILIADDDPSIAMLVGGILKGRGFECMHARNGRQALEMSRTLLPDLLILDVNMPLLNGFDILRMLREDPSTAAMKILLFTGSSSSEDVMRGTELGADSYLCKPFRPLDFLRRIKTLLPDVRPAEMRA